MVTSFNFNFSFFDIYQSRSGSSFISRFRVPIYLVVKQFLGCLKEKFWCYYRTFVSLRSHIFASIEKFSSQLCNVANETLVTYTDLFVSLVHSRFNSPNDILVITKTKCITPLVFSPASLLFISQFYDTLFRLTSSPISFHVVG